MTVARTLTSFRVKLRSGRRVEVQASIDKDGTPRVWAREDGGQPIIVPGVKGLLLLQDAIRRALRAAGVREPSQLALPEPERNTG